MSITTTECLSGHRLALRLLCAALLMVVTGCGSPPAAELPEASAHGWSVTAWGEHFEVFPEGDALVAGQTSTAHTHVTRLAGFAPLVDGKVEIVLAGSAGEQVFSAETADRPGVFNVELTPSQAGEMDLIFRVHTNDGGETVSEDIQGGRIRVGSATEPGRLLRAPAPRGATDGGEPQALLKEQQWKSDFATAWVREGRLAQSLAGLATLRPPAGGENTVTAPVDGVVQAARGNRSWPFVGMQVAQGTPLLWVVPMASPEKSLAKLEAEVESLSSELATARSRSARLEELLILEATSQREFEEARGRVAGLESRHRAATRDLQAARSSRSGASGASGASGEAQGIPLRAPFAGQIAAVSANPGATVASGDPLARVVRTDKVWIEVAMAPQDARRLTSSGLRGVVLEDPESGSVRIEDGLSLVSIAPEVSQQTGTVSVFLEAPASTGFALGTTVAAQVLLSQEETGMIVPATALVDDGGVPVVYLQLSGETFVRQEVTVLARQGDRVLVDQLVAGQRLVTQGGNAIRRVSLMNSGGGHGHVH